MNARVQPSSGKHPPKPHLALSLGVIGHRPNRLPEAARPRVEAEIDSVIIALATAAGAAQARHSDDFVAGDPILTLVSALAEGADRLAAARSLRAGFQLDVPLPFAQDVYEQDFADVASVGEFRDLLRQARSVLTLPGERKAESKAYETVGLTVLGQSDILLAVWDGGPSAGRGGTTEMVQTAIRAGLPIIHVDANGQSPTRIILRGLSPTSLAVEAIEELPSTGLTGLPDVVELLVAPPRDHAEHAKLQRYLSETLDYKRMRVEFPRLQAFVRVRPCKRTDRDTPKPEPLAAEFAAAVSPVAQPEQVGLLANAFGWADAVGIYFAQTFRGAFIFNFLAGAFAVVVAALSLFVPGWKPVCVLVEVLLIGGVLHNTWRGKHQQWHLRWVESRELAERLRVAGALWVLGTRPVSVPGPEPEPSWTGWYVRALVREQGMRSGSLAGDRLVKAKDVLVGLLAGQCEYHKKTTEPRMRKLHERLEDIGLCLFIGTLVVAVAYLVFAAMSMSSSCPVPECADEIIKHAVAAVSAALPALATALYGIRVIGDFEGIAHRSARTHMALQQLIDMIEKEAPELNVLRARARAGAETMLGDVSTWRLAAESRGLSLP